MNIIWVVDCWTEGGTSEQIKHDIVEYLNSTDHSVAFMTYDSIPLDPILIQWRDKNQNRVIDCDLDSPFEDLEWSTMTWVGFFIDVCISIRPCGIFPAGLRYPDRITDMTVRLDLTTDSIGNRWSPKRFRRFLPTKFKTNLQGINLIA